MVQFAQFLLLPHLRFVCKTRISNSKFLNGLNSLSLSIYPSISLPPLSIFMSNRRLFKVSVMLSGQYIYCFLVSSTLLFISIFRSLGVCVRARYIYMCLQFVYSVTETI